MLDVELMLNTFQDNISELQALNLKTYSAIAKKISEGEDSSDLLDNLMTQLDLQEKLSKFAIDTSLIFEED